MTRDFGVELDAMLRRTVELKGSDLHLVPGRPPLIRLHGELTPLNAAQPLSADEVRGLVYAVLDPPRRQRLEQDLELDFSHSIPGVSRFRGNAMWQRNTIAVLIRVVPWEIPELEQLGLPEAVEALSDVPRGLVLVTGPTGSGKSTTLASLIGRINRERSESIITIEDPIEFLHGHGSCLIRQREVGTDTLSFANALRNALRHDPDVLMIGEMRDRDSIAIALTAAETGHLVLSTLHTQTAPLAVVRIIDVFPEDARNQIRQQLANSLQAIVAQQILPRVDGLGRVVAAEILIATPGVRNLIREGKEHQLYSAIETGRAVGMQTMDRALSRLYRAGVITSEVALEHCVDKKELERQLLG